MNNNYFMTLSDLEISNKKRKDNLAKFNINNNDDLLDYNIRG